MLGWLKERRDRRRTARSLYGSIVTQAREPAFYARWGVPDTVEGRLEMVVLHLSLVLRRLSGEGQAGNRLGRALTEAFVVDVDDSLREMTVGDLSVPRQVKQAVGVLQARYSLYSPAVAAAADDGLVRALGVGLASLAGAEHLNADALCGYIREANRTLAMRAGAEMLAGRIDWPPARAERASACDAGASDGRPL